MTDFGTLTLAKQTTHTLALGYDLKRTAPKIIK